MASLGYSPITRPAAIADEDVYSAWIDYTGVPAAISGGLGAVGFNIASQAGQVKTGTSIFAATRYGYGLALLLESSVGTMLFATALTFVDPEHKIEGFGLDETRFYQEHLEGSWTNLKASAIAVAQQDVPLTKKWM
jgi:hypothetical protein